MAVLAADVVGYSRLMGADEEGTLSRLKAIRKALIDPVIASHRGRIVKTTGDGLLAEFISAVDAARCAADVQRGMIEQHDGLRQDQRIELRIGIHIGDIIFDDGDIFGDGVNIAARLEGIATPGGICVSDDAFRLLRGKVAFDFTDMGEQSLKNIAMPMRAWQLQLNHSAPILSANVAVKTSEPLSLPDKPSIAVLPFQNMSGDLDQEYFADGMVEDIITALSKFKSLFVISRNSSFSYKGKSPDIRHVGLELGVRYVLEGSVRKAGNLIRITGQLVDASTGIHLWADRIDGALADVFQLQDQVTEKVVRAIAPRLETAEIDRSNRKPIGVGNLRAYDCYLRSLVYLRQPSRQGIELATVLLKNAISLDAEFAPAYGLLLQCYAYRKGWGLVLNSEEENAEILRLARIVLRVGQDDAAALNDAAWAIAYVLLDLSHAQTLIDRALVLNPNLAHAWANSGWINLWSGRISLAIEHFSRALRHDPLQGQHHMTVRTGMAHALFFLSRYGEAMAWAENNMREDVSAHPSLRIYAASAAFADLTDVAHAAIARLRMIDPDIRISRLGSYFGPYGSEHIEKYTQGLRQAGLPE